MKPEKQQLIHDLLADPSRREATLLAGTKILRRRRQWRIARQTFALVTLIPAILVMVWQNRQPRMVAKVESPATRPAPAFQAQSLTDEQLLALFPNIPVGLARLPNGKKLLIFPRPADEARYLTRL